MNLIQRARIMSLDHYIFFATLTYNPESLPIYNLDDGRTIPYADISDVQKMFKRIRKDNLFLRPFKYFFVSERGKKGRPHYHGMIFIPKSKEDDTLYPAVMEKHISNTLITEWRRNYGTRRKPVWKPLFTYRVKYAHGKRYCNFDLHYVVPFATEHGSDDVAFYISKYILKPSRREIRLQQALHLNLTPDEFDTVWNVVRSRSFCSLGFGASTDLEKNYIRSCIERSADHLDGLKYYALDGSTQPLSKYYRKLLDPSHAERSFKARPEFIDARDLSQIHQVMDKARIIEKQVINKDISTFYPD